MITLPASPRAPTCSDISAKLCLDSSQSLRRDKHARQQEAEAQRAHVNSLHSQIYQN